MATLEYENSKGIKDCLTRIPVGEWKKAAMGKGNASKDDVAAALRPMLPDHLRNDPDLPTDVTDAVGIALGWAKLNLRTLPEPRQQMRGGA